MKKSILLLIILTSIFNVSAQKFENIAKVPPMGWNSWNKFGCDISEELIMNMADIMVNSGMQDAGYEYVVIDDCWQVARDKNGEIIVDKDRSRSLSKIPSIESQRSTISPVVRHK